MKTNYHLIAMVGILVLTTSCKDKEAVSPDITVLSPKPHQVIEDKDSVEIKAVFKPKGASITSYSMTVKDKQDKLLFNDQRSCDCKSRDKVEVKASFRHDVDKTSDLFLEIKAVLDDGREIGEKIPFILAE
ncbi:hypothetical protein ACWKW6_00385 [Dyadobacter jiangsuensis]|uniref:hypothetical protein n=1 Tax=Dyadobacter fermentans TaxID=94254 RepID=UPI001CBCFF0F|nr:hypothetical protein [Dyadobacter fermentans]MBZ1362110.1 hypothetical protein [Dyadobacter fermentans]